MALDAETIVDRAIDWHMRQADMDDTDWHAFVAWLEEDPAHAQAFDAVALDMAVLADQPELYPVATTPVAEQPRLQEGPAARSRRIWAWAGGGVAVAAAASLALALLPTGSTGGGAPYAVETKPGEQRDIALADGTRIELNGATRLLLDRSNPRVATLEAGEATFHVRHDRQNPFTVRSGKLTVQDLGTVFNVARDGARLEVQVAEGSVLFQPKRDAVTLNAGAAITAREDLGQIAVGRVDVAKVGVWRDRAMSFSGEPFGRVSTAIRRIDGVTLIVDSDLSQRSFTGMVRLSGKAEQDVPHLAALVGAKWHHDGDRWVISPR
ncbi:FecR family protein [Sphingomonas sp. MMS24-J45]|uniref:FecR family protein n=1 Tax=Sphingomonas sp. MMS24-J45 TaxID=3238806 RepID=UPI00385082BE